MAGRKKHVRPDFVARFEDKTHSASLVSGHWYLYENVPGDSHRYLGTITEKGLRPGKPRKARPTQVSTEPIATPKLVSVGVDISEYGFSKAILDLCPDSWKKRVGIKWRAVLIEIIVAQSPHSYLRKERDLSDVRVDVGNHRRILQREIGITINELWLLLGNIYWIRSDINGISSISEAQRNFCQEHHIHLEVIS